jgi:cyclophilin family peptidyl-prolyl cis-trans isomerase
MNLIAIAAALPLLSSVEPAPLRGGPEVKWNAPSTFVQGQPYKVQITITAPSDGTVVANWLLSEAAFTVDGKALGKRDDAGTLNLPPGFKIEGALDLSPHLTEVKAPFKLGYASEIVDTPAVEVSLFETAPSGLKFMEMPADQLDDYQVLLQTNRGDILVKFWPEVAPGHVRNYLDLAYTGFYDGTTFHRVIPGFMIQGGDPTATGGGDGPRPNLKAEFNDRKHVRGVLSMARRGTPNMPGPSDPLKDTASCQFFVMHATNPALDGNYTAFGETVSGLEVVDKIVNAPRDPRDKPTEPQKIERAIVLKAPAK